jgi:hypothetical protein
MGPQWHMPVNLVIWEAQMRSITVQSQSGHKTLSQQITGNVGTTQATQEACDQRMEMKGKPGQKSL